MNTPDESLHGVPDFTDEPKAITGSIQDESIRPGRPIHRTIPPTPSDKKTRISPRRAVTDAFEPVKISSSMALHDIIRVLANHSCKDLTDALDLEKCSRLPTRGGGFGDIYEGTLRDGQKVAIKCARLFISSNEGLSQTTKSLARELYAWSKCKHENLLELHGLADYHNQIAIVSPWMGNGTLPYYISQHPECIEIQDLCYQLSCGVAYLHGLGIVHGDIKGANVLVSDDGVAKLADFGNTSLRSYSLQFSGAPDESALSVRWTAPELLSGVTNISLEADVYALAMTILEVITGNVPFYGRSENAVLGDVMFRGKVPERSNIHFPEDNEERSALWGMLQKCWASQPRERPSASDIKDHVSWSKLIAER